MPYLEDSDQTEVAKDSVFVPNDNKSWDEEQLWPIRSTRGQPLERYGKVYTFSVLHSNASNQPWYKHIIFIFWSMNM